MQVIKCPACGHPISPHSVLADGKLSCPGCKKSYSFRKKAAPAEPHDGAEPPADAPPAAASRPAEAVAEAPAAAHAPAPKHSKIPPRSFPGMRKPAHVATANGGGLEHEASDGKASAHSSKAARKRLMVLLLAGGLVLVLGLLALFVKLQFNAAAEAQRVAADQVLQVLGLKWLIEGEGVKECEEAWRDLRAEKNAAVLAEIIAYPPEKRELGLRVWMYRQRSQEQLNRITTFLSFLDNDSNQLLYLKATESRDSVHTEDVAIDWLTFRGYQVLENLKQKGGGSATAGAKADSAPPGVSTPPGELKMTMFGAPLTVEFNSGQSSIDLNSGFLQVAYQASCPGLNGPGDGSGALQGLATIQQGRYILNLKAEIQEYLSNSGHWWYESFEKSGGKTPPATPAPPAEAAPPPAETR
jgi:uncharacterized Zn finger protein (UPF0148 family)